MTTLATQLNARSADFQANAAAMKVVVDDLKAQVLRLELEQIDLESRYASDFPLVEENARKL